MPVACRETPMKTVHLLVGVLGTLALAARAEAQILYATTSAGGVTGTVVPGELYVLNPATGAMVQDVGPLNDAFGANYDVTGLAFQPTTGLLYGSTGNSNAANAAKLITV